MEKDEGSPETLHRAFSRGKKKEIEIENKPGFKKM